jgi:outer membrane murein-binding lipoprotein Lpp
MRVIITGLVMMGVGAAGWGAATVTKAQEGASDTAGVDSILDRLEKRLMDQDNEGLTFDEATTGGTTANPLPPDAKIKLPPQKMTSGTAENDRLKSLANAVTTLENQVDQLASDVQKTRQTIIDEAAIDNFISVEAQLQQSDSAAIKTINVKLDGYNVFELTETAGLWLPTKSIPLYAGPLQPGNHRLDLEARIVMKHKLSLPLNGDVYRFVNKSFEVKVPAGGGSARYVISIAPPEKLDGTADATIKEIL